MCGRYTIYTDADERELLELLRFADLRASESGVSYKTGEIFPTDVAPLLTLGQKNGMKVSLCGWGFKVRGNLIINARRETLSEKPSFRDCLQNGRCVVPSTGFFEWDARKNKYLFSLPDTGVVYMAGLTRDGEHGPEFTIITADANDSVLPVHNRMPLVLTKGGLRDWLSGETDPAQVTVPLLERKLIS